MKTWITPHRFRLAPRQQRGQARQPFVGPSRVHHPATTPLQWAPKPIPWALALVALVACIQGCGSEEGNTSNQSRCTADIQCGGTFICMDGQCVLPTRNDAGQNTTPDTGTDGAVEDTEEPTDTTRSPDSDLTDSGPADTDATDTTTDTTSDTTVTDTVPDEPDAEIDITPPPPDVEPYNDCNAYGCAGVRVCDAQTNTCTENTYCMTQADCDPGRICSMGSCREPLEEGCLDDSDCGTGWVCLTHLGECEVLTNCASDGDCAGDRRCNAMQICADCLSDEECPGNQTCNTGSCRERFAQCTNDLDCIGSRICNTGTGICDDGACMADAYEGNQTSDAAVLLTPGAYSANFCDGDDWFAVDLNAGDGLFVSLTSEPNDSFQEMSLQDPDLIPIRFGLETISGYTTTWIEQAPATGRYFIHVATFESNSVNYTLNIQAIPDGFCQDDRFER
ncbi:MAG: hypothetical protein AAFX99_27920, partial [Myxococcota bacterium]